MFNYGLGAGDTRAQLPLVGHDFGGFGAKGPVEGTDASLVSCEIRHAGDALRALRLERIDLLKIDCEGSELEVFNAMPRELWASCKWIVGEMHDASGFAILAMLAPRFDVDVRKRMFNGCFRFHACNLANVGKLREEFNVSALQS